MHCSFQSVSEVKMYFCVFVQTASAESNSKGFTFFDKEHHNKSDEDRESPYS